MKKAFQIILLVVILLSAMPPGGQARALPAVDDQPSFPIRAAFVYPWFPQGWTQHGIFPYTNFHPQSGYYDSTSTTVIQGQIAAMQYGGISAGILSWWGQGTLTDQRVPIILAATAGSPFRWSVYYEAEAYGNPTPTQIASDLAYLQSHYGADPSFLRIGGRFVVFVYADGADRCGMVDRWKQANLVNAYVVLKLFPGYTDCANQPDGWHQYSPAVPSASHLPYSYAISPGFWKIGEGVTLARNLNCWSMDVRAMVASGANFQLVTTFSEWGEGTAVEAATEWASPSGYGAYLDALHDNGGVGAQPTFSDVQCRYWAFNNIESVYKAGITGGCDTNPLKYCPEVYVTRAQMAVFLLRGINGSGYNPPALGGAGTGFGDVPASYWAAAWIKALADAGITGGCGGGNFCPEGIVTRDQMAVFLLRAEHGSAYAPPTATGILFGDVSPDYWAAAWIEQLASEGITGGCGSGNFCPTNQVSRAQMAVFMVKTFHLP